MSQAELHFLRARLLGGKLNKAKKGELKTPLPVGLVYDDAGRTVFDPDDEVRHAIRMLFAFFRETGSRYGVVHAFAKKGLRFDNISHDLLMRAVVKHTDCRWVLLYVERWLKAPVAMLDGSLVYPEKGTPKGGVASPLLANLFLHYVFDHWMKRNYSHVPFERYADDAVCHCRTESLAKQLKADLEIRFGE